MDSPAYKSLAVIMALVGAAIGCADHVARPDPVETVPLQPTEMHDMDSDGPAVLDAGFDDHFVDREPITDVDGGVRIGEDDSVSSRADYTSVSMGYAHACATHEGGHVTCWGISVSNPGSPFWFGQGDVGEGSIRLLAADGFSTCGIDDAEDAKCWGMVPSCPDCGRATTTSLLVGRHAACKLSDKNDLHCWGELHEWMELLDARHSRADVVLMAGDAELCVVDVDGSIHCTGSLREGGELRQFAEPTVALDVGDGQACIVTAVGRIRCWGSSAIDPCNEHEVCDGPLTLRQRFESVVVAGSFVCGLGIDGSAICWDPYLCVENALEVCRTSRVEGPFRQIAVDFAGACGVRVDGRVECWGIGQVGNTTPP